MANPKSPFVYFSVKEVLEAESNSFVVQIGNDFYSKDGDLVFSLSQAEKHYNTLLSNIKTTMAEGNEKQRVAAKKCLLSLRILPLRIH